MPPRDAEKTTFKTPIRNFYYTMMPFRLKNASTAYQRTMTTIFQDLMHREMEDYVDDIVVMSSVKIMSKYWKKCLGIVGSSR